MADINKIIYDVASSIGYPALKLEQRRVLKAFVEGKDVFVSLPTGYGKSLCYALLPFVFVVKNKLKKKTSIVVSFPFGSVDERPGQGSFTFVEQARHRCTLNILLLSKSQVSLS